MANTRDEREKEYWLAFNFISTVIGLKLDKLSCEVNSI